MAYQAQSGLALQLLVLELTVVALAVATALGCVDLTVAKHVQDSTALIAELWLAGSVVVGAAPGIVLATGVFVDVPVVAHGPEGATKSGLGWGPVASTLIGSARSSRALHQSLIRLLEEEWRWNMALVKRQRRRLYLAFALPWIVGVPVAILGMLRIFVFADGVPYFTLRQDALYACAVAGLAIGAWHMAKAPEPVDDTIAGSGRDGPAGSGEPRGMLSSTHAVTVAWRTLLVSIGLSATAGLAASILATSTKWGPAIVYAGVWTMSVLIVAVGAGHVAATVVVRAAVGRRRRGHSA